MCDIDLDLTEDERRQLEANPIDTQEHGTAPKNTEPLAAGFPPNYRENQTGAFPPANFHSDAREHLD